jgi:3-phosphoshikimate 1-carboxyvinyltransferase
MLTTRPKRSAFMPATTALAPLALKHKIKINNPDVVSKSYPSFWDDLKKAGFHFK